MGSMQLVSKPRLPEPRLSPVRHGEANERWPSLLALPDLTDIQARCLYTPWVADATRLEASAQPQQVCIRGKASVLSPANHGRVLFKLCFSQPYSDVDLSFDVKGAQMKTLPRATENFRFW